MLFIEENKLKKHNYHLQRILANNVHSTVY